MKPTETDEFPVSVLQNQQRLLANNYVPLDKEEIREDLSSAVLNTGRSELYNECMTESELYKNLGSLTKSKDQWEEKIPYVASLLSSESTKIKAKALWLLGEMGLKFPLAIKDSVPTIAAFCDSEEPLLRERAVNALGRIGRGCYQTIEPYWAGLFRFAHDEEASVRLAFFWASENIATKTPDPYKDYMSLFAELLHDSDDRVRMEAPEIFRVLGKRRPEFVEPYLELLRNIAETDSNRVVRIHCLGAVKAAGNSRERR